MTTSTYAEPRSATNWPMYAALGAGVALVLAAVGGFWDITGNDTGQGESLADFLTVVAIVLVATAVVFLLVVRGAERGNAGRRALILSIIGAVTLVVFWAGLPPVLAFGAIACAMAGRSSAGLSGMAKVAVGIAGLTLVLAVVAAIAG